MAEPEITLEEQIAEVERELRFRERTYPRWVRLPMPKLTAHAAALHLARMRAVLDSLEQLKALREGSR